MFAFDRPWTFVIRSKQEEEGFLKASKASRRFPPIDYNEKMVICILAGSYGDATSAVEIDSIVEGEKLVKVYSHASGSRRLSGGCAAQVVATDRISLPVEFEWSRPFKGQ